VICFLDMCLITFLFPCAVNVYKTLYRTIIDARKAKKLARTQDVHGSDAATAEEQTQDSEGCHPFSGEREQVESGDRSKLLEPRHWLDFAKGKHRLEIICLGLPSPH